MPWRGHNAHFCHVCGRNIKQCGPLSARYKCADCGPRNAIRNHRHLIAHEGPFFEHWRRRSLAALGIFTPPPEIPAELDTRDPAA